MPGFQGAAGSPSMIPFWQAGQGNQPARYSMIPSEGVATANIQSDLQKQLQESANAFSGQQGAYTRQFQGEQAGAQRQFEGEQGAAQRSNQLQISQLPYQFKQGIFDKVFPMVSPLIQGLAGGVGGMGGGYGSGAPGSFSVGGGVGGQNTGQSPIAPQGIWSPQQVEQQVNAQQAQNAAKAAGQQRQNRTEAAGQGFGSNSPLLQALNAGVQNQLMASNASAARDTRFQAAQGNAQQLLDSQKAAEQQWQDFNSLDVARRQLGVTAQGQGLNFTSSLVAALAGML